LEEPEEMLQAVALTTDADERTCRMEGADHKLSTKLIYEASVRGDQKSPFFAFDWNNFAPPRVMFFAWLLV